MRNCIGRGILRESTRINRIGGVSQRQDTDEDTIGTSYLANSGWDSWAPRDCCISMAASSRKFGVGGTVHVLRTTFFVNSRSRCVDRGRDSNYAPQPFRVLCSCLGDFLRCPQQSRTLTPPCSCLKYSTKSAKQGTLLGDSIPANLK